MHNEWKKEWRGEFSAILAADTFAAFFFSSVTFVCLLYFIIETHLQNKNIPHITSSKSRLYYKRVSSKGVLVLLRIIELIGRSAVSADAFSSLNQFTMMNSPHLATQLVLCWALSLCLHVSLSLRLESCFLPGSGWVMWPGAEGKKDGRHKSNDIWSGQFRISPVWRISSKHCLSYMKSCGSSPPVAGRK